MRVIGQSTLADGAPYVHLGYLAAAPTPPTTRVADSLLWNTSVAILIVGSAMLLVRWLAGRAGRLTLAGRKVALSVAAVLVLGIGVIVMQLAYARGTNVLSHPEEFTRDRALMLVGAVVSHGDGDWIPADMEEVRKVVGIATEDAWLRPMRIDTRVQGNKITYVITSAGPDGVFDTADDVRFSESFEPTNRPATTRPRPAGRKK